MPIDGDAKTSLVAKRGRTPFVDNVAIIRATKTLSSWQVQQHAFTIALLVSLHA